MNGPRSAYSSTEVAPGHIVTAAVLAIVVVLLPRFSGLAPGPVTIAAALLVVATGIHLATVRLTVTSDVIWIGQGPWRWPARKIPTSAVTDAHAENLNRAQIFGLGVPFHWDTTRLTIRPGLTLVLVTATGEHIRVSTADPVAASRIINAGRGYTAPRI